MPSGAGVRIAAALLFLSGGGGGGEMVTELPSITGKQLIRLLLKDGWQDSGKRTHGVALVKVILRAARE